MEIKSPEIHSLAENIYRIGTDTSSAGRLDPNIYLIVYDDEAVLINTGPFKTFNTLREGIISLIQPEKIKTIVITNTDADSCSALPLFEEICPEAGAALHWRSARSIAGNISAMPFFIVNENNWEKKLENGKKILFFPASYLCMPGEIMVYDPDAGILFTSSLFSSFTTEGFRETGYGNIESIKSYQEHYIYDSRIVNSIIEKIQLLPINKIAPARGCVISEEIHKIMKEIRYHSSGSFKDVKKKEITDKSIYRQLCSIVLKRLSGIFSSDDTLQIFSGSEIVVDPDTYAVSSNSLEGWDIWEKLFSLILEKKGISRLSFIESLVRKISREYSLGFPEAYSKVVLNLQSKNINIDENMAKIQGTKNRIREDLQDTEEKLTVCHITGLKNDSFFRIYIEKEYQRAVEKEINSAVLMIALDNINELNSRFGREGGDDALRGISYLIKNYIAESEDRAADYLFKLNGAVFAYYIPECAENCAEKTAETLRERIAASTVFVQDITVSIAVINYYEFFNTAKTPDEAVIKIIETGFARIQSARQSGGNTICGKTDETENIMIVNSPVIIIDPDESYSEIVAAKLTAKGIRTLIAFDGEDGVEKIKKNTPSVIISETMIPGINGFAVREGLLSDATLSSIPFIFASHKKNEDFIRKAASLNVVHYFMKPYSILELTGLVESLIRKRSI